MPWLLGLIGLFVGTFLGGTLFSHGMGIGAVFGKRDAKLGYLRTRVKTGAVLTAAKVPGIAAIDLNERLDGAEPAQHSKAKAVSPSPEAPGAGTKADNPFLPTGEMNAVKFKKSHPTWDGRGVTIGVLDSGVDLDHPALTTTSTGARKIVDWYTGTDPILDADGTWLRMHQTVTGPLFNADGADWTAPAGTFRLAQFVEGATGGGESGGDVNRDGDSDDTFGVLYDPATNDIWVDSDDDHNFTNNPRMRPYGQNHQIGHFGVDNPATPERDQMPFVVEFREDVDLAPLGETGTEDFVNIGIEDGSHATHVAGIAAGNNLFGNANFDGNAPGATLVSGRACVFSGGCTAVALSDGLVEMVLHRDVDVVNISIGGLPALNDANNGRALLYDRIVEELGIQLFISAGNSGPAANTIGDPAVADKVVAVGASISRKTWLYNYGSVVRKEMSMFNFSSRGPREDGGFKPNIVAPGSAISSTPLWLPGAPVAEAGYPLPPGYSMFNGTSMAAPQSTGAAALLLSAARATHRGVTSAALRKALYTSADPIDNIPTYAQGDGLLDVTGAWKLLAAGPLETREYSSDAPVCTPISFALAVPDHGPGIYNRCAADAGGHRPGQARTYNLVVKRTTGPAGAIKHNLRWVGNDGTFAALPYSVKLKRGEAKVIAVVAKPTAGIHSAILRIDDPATPVNDFEVSAVVIAADDLTAPTFSRQYAGTVDRNSYKSYFVTVPEGAAALQINLGRLATSSQTRFISTDPWGLPVEETSSLVCYANFSNPADCNPTQRTYRQPLPGVWEIEVESRRTSPYLDNPYTLSATVFGVDVNPPVVHLPTVAAHTDTAVNWTLTNRFGPVVASAVGGPLGSGRSQRPNIADGEVQLYPVTVPAGATRFTAAINNPSDLGADLDLVVLFNGDVVGISADGDSDESVTLDAPAAGDYVVAVLGYAVPTGHTDFDLLDVYYAPSFGALTVPAGPFSLAPGASRPLAGTVRAELAPGAGRVLVGDLTINTGSGAEIGHGRVVIDAVS